MQSQVSWQYRSEWRKLVTPQLMHDQPIYRWFIYPHSFDRQLVKALLSEMAVPPNGKVWDPFVGAGTTVVACQEQNRIAYGSDLLPLSILVTRAKAKRYDKDLLRRALAGLSFKIQKGTIDRFADVPVVKLALAPTIRIRVSSLFSQIESLDKELQPLFVTALVASLAKVSNAVKSGGWLRLAPEKTVRPADVKQTFIDTMEIMLADLESCECSGQPEVDQRIWLGDARTAKLPSPVDAIITSPPYLNRHDYTRVFALELALVGVSNASELKALRYQTLRSHVEARSLSLPLTGYQQPTSLGDCLCEIESRGHDGRRVTGMIKGYFEDMHLVLKSFYDNLSEGGKAALVLGDVRFSGVMIPVSDLVITLADAVGLTLEKAIIARYRGNSSQQMGKYGREEAKESVLIFTKGRMGTV